MSHRIKFRIFDDGQRSDSLGTRRTSTWFRDQMKSTDESGIERSRGRFVDTS